MRRYVGGVEKLPRPQERENMKQRMKDHVLSTGDFICRCERAFESLSLLRKHQESLCPITMRRTLEELDKSIEEMKEEHRVQHEADLREWNEEKARDVSKISKI